MKTCIKCGGSWIGKEFDTLCVHDFDEPPEPTETLLLQPDETGHFAGERTWLACGGGMSGFHPTREGAIAAWKKAWRERRMPMRAVVPRPVGRMCLKCQRVTFLEEEARCVYCDTSLPCSLPARTFARGTRISFERPGGSAGEGRVMLTDGRDCCWVIPDEGRPCWVPSRKCRAL